MIKFIKLSVLILLQMIILLNIYGANNCLQTITVKFTPFNGVRVYNVSAGNDKRNIIDLGHFNGKDVEKRVNLGKVDVNIVMEKTNSFQGKNDIEVVNIENLKKYAWNYQYNVTNFIGQGTPVAKIQLENFEIVIKDGGTSNGTLTFGCDNGQLKRLNYRFDLIMDLKNLTPETMYGFSSKKNSGTQAYINIQDIVLAQLRESATNKP